MKKFQQNPISQAIWHWQEEAAPVTCRCHLFRATIQFIIVATIGFFLYHWFHKPVIGSLVMLIAMFIFLAAMFVPPLFLAIEKFGQLLGKYVGLGLTWILLTPFFYLCFVPARLINLARHHDKLCRQCPTNLPTYWVPRPPIANKDHFKRQS